MRQVLSRAVGARAIMPARIWAQRWNGGFTRKLNNKTKRKVLFLTTYGIFFCLVVNEVYSSPLLNLGFSGDNGQLSTYYSSITQDLAVAVAQWENLFVNGSAFTLNVDVIFDNSPTSNASSLFITALYNAGPLSVFRQGAVDAVLNGVHNPSGPYDAAIHIGTSYLKNELWFDPNPANIDSIPIDKTDAESVFLHEFGHIFAFNGNRDQSTGALSTNTESQFDSLLSIINNDPYFMGPNAESVYGGPVPLTVGNIYHVGNASGPGAELVTYPADLMNGVVFYTGTRYTISALDAAIAADLGLVVAVPEPSPVAIFSASLVVFWLSGCWRRS
jgi:hypothetical protein